MLPVLIAVGVTVVGIATVMVLDLVARHSAPLDTERQERWFVEHAPAPLRRMLRFAERRVVGGAAVLVLFTVALLASTLVGWILDTTDENRGFARWDQSAAEWGAEHGTTASTRVLEVITQFGATGWLLIAMALVAAVEFYRHRRWAVIGYLAVVGIGVSALNNLLKHLVDRERPMVRPLTDFGSSSFPSGHTAAAAACWAALALVIARHSGRGGRTLGALVALLITVGVATSRVLLGVHWVTDVIAGATVGWAWFFVITLVFGGRLLRFGEPAERIARTAPAHTESTSTETTNNETTNNETTHDDTADADTGLCPSTLTEPLGSSTTEYRP